MVDFSELKVESQLQDNQKSTTFVDLIDYGLLSSDYHQRTTLYTLFN